MRIISDIMHFYLSHAIALRKLSNERSYKFSWILTLAEVFRSPKKMASTYNSLTERSGA